MGRIKKVIFLSSQPLDARNHKRFGIRTLCDNGFNVEYWDTTTALYLETAGCAPRRDTVPFSGTRVIGDKRMLLGLLEGLGNDALVIDNIGFNLNFASIYRALSHSKAVSAFITAGAVPDVREIEASRPVYMNLPRKIKKLVTSSPRRIWRNMAISRLPPSWFGIKPAGLILASGRKSLKYNIPTDNNTVIVWAHALDYDLYLEERAKLDAPLRGSLPMAVYLDACVPFHPDWVFTGGNPGVDPGRYYRPLNDFFGKVEDELGMEVVIAAHPRSDYGAKPGYFGSRRCIKDRTAKLVKDAGLVLAHNSTAIHLANLFGKPITFLTSSELERFDFGPGIRIFAHLHGKKPINVDALPGGGVDWKEELRVDAPSYESYRRDYIKVDDSPELPFWQIAADHFKSI